MSDVRDILLRIARERAQEKQAGMLQTVRTIGARVFNPRGVTALTSKFQGAAGGFQKTLGFAKTELPKLTQTITAKQKNLEMLKAGIGRTGSPIANQQLAAAAKEIEALEAKRSQLASQLQGQFGQMRGHAVDLTAKANDPTIMQTVTPHEQAMKDLLNSYEGTGKTFFQRHAGLKWGLGIGGGGAAGYALLGRNRQPESVQSAPQPGVVPPPINPQGW